jgi:hypothetical protein
MKSTLDTKYI